jgi:hypothetical protein
MARSPRSFLGSELSSLWGERQGAAPLVRLTAGRPTALALRGQTLWLDGLIEG